MKDMIFPEGDFVVWQGNTYRAKSYLKEYELFDIKDVSRINPLRRIYKEQAEDYYLQYAYCNIKGVRYSADSTKNGYCLYHPHISCKYCYQERVENCNEIWLQRRRSDRMIEIETLWFRPYCMEHPSRNKFYVEPMANQNIMTSYLNEVMSLKQTIENLHNLYGERIKMEKELILSQNDYFGQFQIDDCKFNLDMDDIWDIICISPKEKKGSSYIHEIVKYFNKLHY